MPDRAESPTQVGVELPTTDAAPEAGEPPAPAATLPSPRRAIRRWAWFALIVVAVLVVIAALGGFSSVPLERLPVVETGEPVLGVQVDATIDDAYLTTASPYTGEPATDDVEYLVAVATLLNHDEMPAFAVEDRIRVAVADVIDGDTDPTVVLGTRNRSFPDTLQPGIPTEVAYFWELAPGEVDAGTRAGVGVFDTSPIEDHPIFGDTAFADPRAVAQTFIGLERR